MELRILKYFLAIAREGSIIKAAETLYITQPTLSRQIIDLEDQLGTKLLVRGNKNKKITLTEDGIRFRKRAEEIVELAERTEMEFKTQSEEISGDIYIGGGETDSMRFIAKTMIKLQKQYPNIHFHLYSGNADDITEKLDNGLLDFGVLIGPASLENYNYLKFPTTDIWGLLMKKNSSMASKKYIKINDLENIPLIVSNQSLVENQIAGWGIKDFSKLNIVGTYNLVFNASLMVDEGFGYALCLDKLVNTSCESTLCFKPLSPILEVNLDIIWKKNQVFSKAAAKFLEFLAIEFNQK
ncbi:LysR family transcriptional regulator [uncultured Cetobacterium sp.]|uniref:LysR family transcriptional regulator n=1 Tax=uncultured Cetobacterium sp. TaxID=527638 RepID=UPI0025D92C8C|nr:LysR family transcriptional regulator [uncultured Cetobacterium sp.]